MDQHLFLAQIAHSSAHRQSRESIAYAVLKDRTLLDPLMAMALDYQQKNHQKAWWSVELVFEQRINWISPYLEAFCQTLPHLVQDGAVRSASKIGWFALLHQQKNTTFLTAAQTQLIMDSCFDWLIGNAKVASKVYAMRALFELGKNAEFHWLHKELLAIIESGYAEHSAAYRIASRDSIKKIARLASVVK